MPTISFGYELQGSVPPNRLLTVWDTARPNVRYAVQVPPSASRARMQRLVGSAMQIRQRAGLDYLGGPTLGQITSPAPLIGSVTF